MRLPISSCFIIVSAFLLLGLSPSNQRHDLTFQSSLFPCADKDVARYAASEIDAVLVIDGNLDEEAWKNATKSPAFKDLIHGTATHLDTRAAVLWDKDFLYVAYWIEEPDVKATLKDRDDPIYRNDDVELFIAGRDGYYEFEINAFATIYEVFFLWQDTYQRSGYDTMSQFNLKDPLAKKFNGVGYKTHPRGKRYGFWNWDYPGLKKAVKIQGSINSSNDKDQGWTVELALPWSGLEALARPDGRSLPPKDGDVWRMDFSRFNTIKDDKSNDSGGWAWSPHGVWDSHVPECFTYVEFKAKR